jgi:glycosyltransferase involved in cell wall biosynthesis
MHYIEPVRELCSAVHTVPINRSRLADIGYLIRSQFTGRPFLVERDDVAEFRSIVEQIVAFESIDVIHVDQLTMAQFALPFAKRGHGMPGLIFDAHNAVWTITQRLSQSMPFYLRLPLALETKRIKRYEGEIVRDYHATLAVTELDRHALMQAIPLTNSESHPLITVIPIAVDTLAIQPVERRTDSLNIVTLGTLYYPPNADGIRWFIKEVFSLIRSKVPEVKLTIIGKNPPKDFLKLANEPDSGIVITGFVPDLDPYFRDSTVAVIPVRAGGGMRVRILEAFARAVPVVTTTVGLEGIQAQPGRDVLVADHPADFADAVFRILNDKVLQTQLATNGRCLVESNYDWQVVLKDLDDVYRHFA